MSESNGAPPHWQTVALEDIAEVRLGRQRSPDRSTGKHMRPYMRAANVTWDGISLHDVKEMDFSPKEFEVYKLQRGDILLSEASGSASEVGKPAIWNDEVADCCFQNTLLRVRADKSLVRFLHLHFLKDATTGAFANASRGVGIYHLGAQAMSKWEIRLPPLGEQNRIADAVESYVSRLDNAVATLTRVERNLKRYRASVLKSAVEGRLVPTEAELAKQEGRDYEPASVLLERILAERRRRWSESGKKGKYQEPSPPDTSKLPPLPEGWCWATVDQLAAHEPRSLCDGPFGSNLKSSHYTDVGPRVVRLQNIGDGIFRDESAHISEEHFHLLKKHAVYAGDLVVASLGDVLPRAAMIPEWLGQAVVKADCLRFSVHSEMALSTYVMHALNSVSVRKRTEELVHGVGRPRIGLGLLREVAVPVPPRREQNRIVAEVGRLLSVIDSCMAGVARELLRCQHLRQSILKWAFEGKLVDQDPDDQRATVLMERTKIEPHAASNRLGAAEISRRMSSRHLVEDENAIDVVGASSLVHSRGGAR